MKNVTKSVLLCSGMIFLASCNTGKKAEPKPDQTQEIVKKGIDLTAMDTTVRPQDDFYNFVNGGWMKTAKIPADKPSWGSFNMLREETDENSLKILDNLLTEKFTQGSDGQKIQGLYQTYMDMDKRNVDGIKPIEGDLAKIDAISSLEDFQKYMNEATRLGENPLYSWYVYGDLKDSKMNAIYLGSGSLGLGRDYYQKKSETNTEALQKYKQYISDVLAVVGYENADETAGKILAFEQEIASTLLTNEERRDPNLSYNPKTNDELKGLVKNIDLPQYLKNVGVNTDRVIVGELKYYKNLDKFITEKNLPLLKDYLKYNIVAGNASYLNQKLDDLQFDFYSKYLQGQQEQRAMNKRALSLINGVLGEAFGKLYVEKYFPPKAKEEMIVLIDYLKKSFAQHIQDLTWMSAITKEKAMEKLNKFTVKVGYPDKWKDYSKLTILDEAQGGTLYKNLQNVTAWSYQEDLEKVGKPVDKSEWHMSPQTVNAYYSPLNNEIVFPAAILQPPFFNFHADPAVNFGGIGAVIGHEITHGFDDSGARFDGDGNLKNWWTDEDMKNFKDVTGALAEQYNKYEPVAGTFVNGVFTSGENIADLGGVNIAFDALQMYLKDKGEIDKIDDFTQDQRFFISWATIWRTLSTDQYMINQTKTDPHSPGYFRAFGPLVNTEAFYKAFDIKEGDKLYKAPEDRIVIW